MNDIKIILADLVVARKRAIILKEKTGATFLFDILNKILGNLENAIESNDEKYILELSDQIGQLAIHRVEPYDKEYNQELCKLSNKIDKIYEEKK